MSESVTHAGWPIVPYGWIDPKAYSFNVLLLMDAWLVRHISFMKDMEFNRRLAVSLAANPAVLWYFMTKCPDRAEHYRRLTQSAPSGLSQDAVRESEAWILNELDWAVVYVYPAVMDQLPYIQMWDQDRLLSITDFAGKKVLDIGSGTGRLAIAASSRAKWVFACEPVERLREYLREKLKRLGIQNVFVLDGSIEELPFPDEFFDIVVSGHVVGDNLRREDELMHRVLRAGGWIIDCPGEDDRRSPEGPNKTLLELGYQYVHYVSKLGGDVYRYWRQKQGDLAS